jgi:hypothetical protein
MRTTLLIGLCLCAGAMHAADPQPAGAPAPVPGAVHAAAMASHRAAMQAMRAPDVERTWLGVVVTQASPALAHQLRLPGGTGLQVETVLPGSPAAAAGIERYDVLVRLGDQLLVNQAQLQVLLDAHAAGARTSVQVLRQAEEQTLAVVLERRSMPADQPIPAWQMPLPPGAGQAALPPHLRAMMERMPHVGHDPLIMHYVLPPSVAVSDGTTQVTWQASDTGERLEVRDGAGTLIFNGTAAEARARTDLPPLVGRMLRQHAPGLPAPAEIPAPSPR